jgi:dolichol-phosphate mannosyltransferase
MKTNLSLSVVVACYRDAGSVTECYRRLTAVLSGITPHYEIIYVNDASPDNAEEILREIASQDSRVVVVSHTRNFGSQSAFLSGIRVSLGDGVILMDGDLQDPPEVIPQMVDKWREGYHIVYGVRVKRRESIARQIEYKLFYRIFQRMAQFHIPLDAGDFSLMDRRVIETLLNDFPERLVFLRGLRAYTGFKHAGVEYVRDRRFDGASTNSFMNNIRWSRLAIFSFSRKPLEYIFLVASLSVAASILAFVFYFFAYLWKWFRGSYAAPPGYMTLLVIMLFLGTVQLVSLAFIAEYLGHIYEEVKNRPRYIVRDILDNRGKPNEETTYVNSGEGMKDIREVQS